MYWPVSPSRVLCDHHASPILSLARHRKGTLFATISKDEVVIWNVRVGFSARFLLSWVCG